MVATASESKGHHDTKSSTSSFLKTCSSFGAALYRCTFCGTDTGNGSFCQGAQRQRQRQRRRRSSSSSSSSLLSSLFASLVTIKQHRWRNVLFLLPLLVSIVWFIQSQYSLESESSSDSERIGSHDGGKSNFFLLHTGTNGPASHTSPSKNSLDLKTDINWSLEYGIYPPESKENRGTYPPANNYKLDIPWSFDNHMHMIVNENENVDGSANKKESAVDGNGKNGKDKKKKRNNKHGRQVLRTNQSDDNNEGIDNEKHKTMENLDVCQVYFETKRRMEQAKKSSSSSLRRRVVKDDDEEKGKGENHYYDSNRPPFVWVPSYPGSGSELFRELVGAVSSPSMILDDTVATATAVTAANVYEKGNCRQAGVVTCKTHFPVMKKFAIDDVAELSNAIILTRNPFDAIPSWYNHVWEVQNKIQKHSQQAPIDDWIEWKTTKFELALSKYKTFYQTWAVESSPVTMSSTTTMTSGVVSRSNIDTNNHTATGSRPEGVIPAKNASRFLVIPYEDLIDPSKGPALLASVRQYLDDANTDKRHVSKHQRRRHDLGHHKDEHRQEQQQEQEQQPQQPKQTVDVSLEDTCIWKYIVQDRASMKRRHRNDTSSSSSSFTGQERTLIYKVLSDLLETIIPKGNEFYPIIHRYYHQQDREEKSKET